MWWGVQCFEVFLVFPPTEISKDISTPPQGGSDYVCASTNFFYHFLYTFQMLTSLRLTPMGKLARAPRDKPFLKKDRSEMWVCL